MSWKKYVLVAVLGLAAVPAYVVLKPPKRAEPSPIKVERTAERIARGKHLFEHVADCEGCHSERDFTRLAAPTLEGRRGVGFRFPPELGLPGAIVAPNLTSDVETGLGAWTDGEIIRAIREGISRDGRALFPFMPYENFRHMSDEDVFSLVAYMRSLPPVRNELPRSSIAFPVSILMKSAPQPVASVPAVNPQDKVKYGEYLTRMGSCANCHTKMEQGQPVAGMTLAGGEVFNLPGFTVVSANLTPDEETGMGKWSEDFFKSKFHEYGEYTLKGAPKVPASANTIMPWLSLSQLSDDELSAIYAYLRTQKPIRNAVKTRPLS